jgi:hypothetical protein
MSSQHTAAVAFRNVVKAADDTLDLLCRLRGITIGDLSDEEINTFFLNALGDEFFVPPVTSKPDTRP